VARPTAPSREGGVQIPAAAGTFLCSFFLKTVRCHLNSILFMNFHYSAVRNKKWFNHHTKQKSTYACNAADARIWYALKYGNKHLPVMGESAMWHDPRSRVGRAGFTPVLAHRIFCADCSLKLN
jgi:hypothetical protein